MYEGDVKANSGKARILVGATGSVDITLLPEYLRTIKANIDCTLTVLMTKTAETFMHSETMSLFADRVISGESPKDWPTDKPSKLVADHDIIAVLPATANILADAATGSAPNRLTTIILTAEYPILFFPVMGAVMWKKAAVQRNVDQLRSDGYQVVEPVWHENYDVAMQRMVGHPSMPKPEDVVAILRDSLNLK